MPEFRVSWWQDIHWEATIEAPTMREAWRMAQDGEALDAPRRILENELRAPSVEAVEG